MRKPEYLNTFIFYLNGKLRTISIYYRTKERKKRESDGLVERKTSECYLTKNKIFDDNVFGVAKEILLKLYVQNFIFSISHFKFFSFTW